MKKLFTLVAAVAVCFAANATDYYFAGEANGWNNSSTKFVEEEGVLTVSLADFYGNFKIVEDAQWHPQHGAAQAGDSIKFNEPYTLGGEGDGGEALDLGVKLEENYRYKDAKLTLSFGENNALVVTLVAGTLYDHSAAPATYQIVGACTNNWSTADAIQFEDKEGVLTAVVPDLNGTFKIIQDRAWTNQWATNWETGAGLELGVAYTLGAKGEAEPSNLFLANPFGGYKNAVLTLQVGEQMVLTLVSGEFYVTTNNWYFPGTKLGWNCDETTQFTPVEGKENTYEFLAAEFGGDFKVVYGNWAVEFGANVAGDAWEINKEYVMTYPCAGNLNPLSEDVYTDVTITITVDYENAQVKLLISNEDDTAVENITVDSKKAFKTIEDGQIVIYKNNKRYNVLGSEL